MILIVPTSHIESFYIVASLQTIFTIGFSRVISVKKRKYLIINTKRVWEGVFMVNEDLNEEVTLK